MKPLTRHNILSHLLGRIAVFSLVFGMTLVPSTASASKAYIDTPSFNIGIHNVGHKRYYNNRRSYRNSYRNNGYKYRNRNYYPRNNYYKKNSYKKNYYKRNNYYNNNYYYKPKRYKRNDYTPSCPVAGYSTGYDDDRNCYSHKDHYHCD